MGNGDASSRAGTNLRKGVLEYCVLALVADQERYGGELAAFLAERELIASEGTLYPLLARLRSTGAVVARWVTDEEHRPRRYYRLTEAGLAELSAFRSLWGRLSTTVNEILGG